MTLGRDAGDGPAVQVTGLSMTYPNGTRVLDGIDLTIEQGEVVALVGANGAGKSTLLRCLVRLLQPTAGTVSLQGVDITACRRSELRAVRAGVGFVFQHFQLVPRLSAYQNVLHGAMGRHGLRALSSMTSSSDSRRAAMSCLDRVGLAHLARQRCDTLSGGQQQRVAIARMLMQDPRLVLADEPVASLDPTAAIDVMELLTELTAERRLTVVVALHQIDFALRYTKRIIGLSGGSLTLDRHAGECPRQELDGVYAIPVP